MTRRNFSRAVKVQAIKRATREGIVYCDVCGLPCTKFELDHIRPDGLIGEPTLDNCQLSCIPCHRAKTPQDVARIAKAKRVEARHLGVKASAPKLQSAGFRHVEKERAIDKTCLPPLPRRELFREG